MSWHKTSEVLPDFYDVLGLKISHNVLGKDINGEYHIVSLWEYKYIWITNSGERVNIVYWKELE